MSSLRSCVLASIVLIATSFAASIDQQQKYPLRIVHQFPPNTTWIENMAIRNNGQILYTSVLDGKFYLVDPKLPPNAVPSVIATFGETTALTGIAEAEDDVFYVQGIRNSNARAFQFPANASTVWKIGMRPYTSTGHAPSQRVADIPQVLLPNGMTLLSRSAGALLIADPVLGKIWRFCVRTGQYEVVNDDEAIQPAQGMVPSFGVNSIRVVGSTMYFTNTNKALVGRFQIYQDGRPRGKPALIASSLPYTSLDDFDISADGSTWLMDNASNSVLRIYQDGKVVTVAGGPNSTEIKDPVSARFGRTPQDKGILYVSMNGRTSGKDGKVSTTDAKIVAINTQM